MGKWHSVIVCTKFVQRVFYAKSHWLFKNALFITILVEFFEIKRFSELAF